MAFMIMAFSRALQDYVPQWTLKELIRKNGKELQTLKDMAFLKVRTQAGGGLVYTNVRNRPQT
ncbi:Hypothetical predicted protein [Xyrichtys novacula]|uniref:Uncharacterized protein n=1 Tax=Xyrichtys novacula TaxID=13765 RepID=A0AAV1ENP1_XYRNO|nr:Hypothetical predicted protein [Xyrichtys novacula]